MMRLTMIGDGDPSWITATLPSNSNYISFKANENSTKEGKEAYYRNTQAKIDVVDTRGGVSSILKSFYFNLEQEPDIQQTSGGGGDTPTSSVEINIEFKNRRSVDVDFTGELRLSVNTTLSDGNVITSVVDATLPNADLEANNFSVLAGETSLEYQTACTLADGPLPVNMLTTMSSTITGWMLSWYDSSKHERSYTALNPYSMSGEGLKFINGGSYTITFDN
jgi:hypothetical protein